METPKQALASMAADWSQLPSELLQLISQKLDNELCLLQFRSVCSTWRSSSIHNHKHKNPLPLTLPQFPQKPSMVNMAYFYNILNSNYSTSHLIKHTFFLIKPPQHQPSLNPWLVRIGPDVYGKPQLWHPFPSDQLLSSDFNYMLDFNKFSFRVLGHMFYMHHLVGDTHQNFFSFSVAAVCQGEQPPVIVTRDFTDEVMMFRCGDDGWTTIANMSTYDGGNVCVFKGRPCVVDETGRTLMIGPDLTTHLIAEPVFGGQKKILVESSEFELLLVDRYEDGRLNGVWIDVFKLDEKEKRWVKLTNLGDKVLFLRKGCSFIASASELGFANGNCVIYSKSHSFHDLNIRKCKMSVFHLDQGQASPLSDYPEYFKLFWPPPDWVTDLHL